MQSKSTRTDHADFHTAYSRRPGMLPPFSAAFQEIKRSTAVFSVVTHAGNKTKEKDWVKAQMMKTLQARPFRRPESCNGSVAGRVAQEIEENGSGNGT